MRKQNIKQGVNLGAIIIDKLRSDFVRDSFKSLGRKQILLDLGCGLKPFRNIYSKYVDRYIGIDIPSSPHDKSKIDIYATGLTLPFKNSTFDIVLSTEVMEHVSDPKLFLDEIHRVLKPNGHLVLTTPFLDPIHEDPYDYYRYTIYGLRYLLKESNFYCVSIEPFSEMIGVLISFSIQVQLKFWHGVSGFFNLECSNNPFIFLFVYLPQMVYLGLLKFGKSSSPIKKVIERLSYTTKGYGILAQNNKPNYSK